ncbi:hypothetical protein B0H16DRAFT_1787935 [Mycena metata]|uniref:Uncharacterized protein n=1 Tax=Mycena metata TaxID=1033252 RepID=A0AAD7HME3_9AGAR|nr:hypothetical protein B0H16DRAFT_1787935 [Mycena metata]
MVSLVLFSLANTVLGLASGKSMSTSASTSAATYPSATYCSPPAATSISLTNSAISTQNGAFPPGPMELGLLSLQSPFLFWAPPASTGSWDLVKNGSLFLIEHSQVPGLMLTADQGGADAQLATGPVGLQQWNITCTTCPTNGFANDCEFANSDPFPKFPQINTRVCILNQRLRELGNATLVGECPGGLRNNTFKIDYHQ